jgi:hypothetical protein
MKKTSYSFIATQDLVDMVLGDEDNERTELEYELAQRLDLAVNLDSEEGYGDDSRV